MITKKEYKIAKRIVIEYENQLNILAVSSAKRKVCSLGVNYEVCSEHPLNELGCNTCEKYIEQT